MLWLSTSTYLLLLYVLPTPGHWGGMEQVDREPGLVLWPLGFRSTYVVPRLGLLFSRIETAKGTSTSKGLRRIIPKKNRHKSSSKEQGWLNRVLQGWASFWQRGRKKAYRRVAFSRLPFFSVFAFSLGETGKGGNDGGRGTQKICIMGF